jgi:hypothetical protein
MFYFQTIYGHTLNTKKGNMFFFVLESGDECIESNKQIAFSSQHLFNIVKYNCKYNADVHHIILHNLHISYVKSDM